MGKDLNGHFTKEDIQIAKHTHEKTSQPWNKGGEQRPKLQRQ